MTEASDYVTHALIYCGSDEKLPSVTDEPGRPHSTIHTTKDRREAKPDEFGILSMGSVTGEHRDDITGQPWPSDLVEKGK